MKKRSIVLISSFMVGVIIISIIVVMYPPNSTIHTDSAFPSKSIVKNYGQTVKIIVDVKGRLENSNILPLVITQVISVDPSKSEIKTMGFLPTNYYVWRENGTMLDREVTPLENNLSFNITDETGNYPIDKSRLPGVGFGIYDALGVSMAKLVMMIFQMV